MIRSVHTKVNNLKKKFLIFKFFILFSGIFATTGTSSSELSKVEGESVGQDITLELPVGAELKHFNIYFNKNGNQSEITGIELAYAPTPGGPIFTSTLAGSKGSQGAKYNAGATAGFELDTFEFERSPIAGKPLSSLMIKKGFYGTGWGVSGAGGQKIVKKLDPSQEFGGLIVRTDGQKIYGLGVIVKGQGVGANQIASDDPFADPETDNPFAEPETENPFSESGQAPIARRPGDTQTILNNAGSMPQTKPSDELFIDYWVEAATPIKHPSPQPPKGTAEYDFWENRYIAPLTIKVQKLPSGSIMIENVNGHLDYKTNKENEYERAPTVGHGNLTLNKVDETTYQSGGMKAFIKRGSHSAEDLLFLQVPEPWDFLSRHYERAKLPFSLALSSNRFAAEQQGQRTARDDSFSTLVKLYQPNLYGYDPNNINPIEPGSGKMKQIFATADLQDYSFDDALSKGVPYGLKGYNLLKSSNTVRTISTSSEVQAQKETSRAMGANVPGFGASFSEDFVEKNRNASTASTTLSLLKAHSYALVQDFPNGKLHFYFRSLIQTLIDQPASDLAAYDKIVEDYGTHYANAITYGGMAYNERSTSSRESAQTLVEKWKANFSGESNGVGGNLGQGQGNTDGTYSSFSETKENWTSIGGSGAFDKGSFQVNDDKLMPVAYDLRPISDLVNNIYFPTEGDQKKIMRVLQVRQNLGHAINKKLASLPRLSNASSPMSSVYRLNVSSIKCTSGGAQDRSKLQLSGKFDLKINDSLGERTENIFNVPIVERERVQVVKLDCGEQAQVHSVNKDFVLVNSLDRPVEPTFELVAEDLYSYRAPTYTREEKVALNPFLRDVASPVGESLMGLFMGREEVRKDVDGEYRDILLKASHVLTPRTDRLRGVSAADLYAGPQNGIMIFGSQEGGNIFVQYTIQKVQGRAAINRDVQMQNK